jgi:hypothetical protein
MPISAVPKIGVSKSVSKEREICTDYNGDRRRHVGAHRFQMISARANPTYRRNSFRDESTRGGGWEN